MQADNQHTPRRPLILLSGVFSLLMPHHVKLIQKIKHRWPDSTLIVGINGDRRARELKPYAVLTAAERAYLLAHIKGVDKVLIFEEDTPCELIRRIRPDVVVKGKEYAYTCIPERVTCKQLGIELVFIDAGRKHTSDIVQKILAAAAGGARTHGKRERARNRRKPPQWQD